MNAPVFLSDKVLEHAHPHVASLERKRLRAYIGLLLGDVASILIGFALAGLAYRGSLPDAQAMLEAQLFLPLFLTIAIYQRVYSIRSLTDGVHVMLRIIGAVIVSAALLNFLAFFAKFNTSFSRGTFTLGLVFSALLMCSLRLVATRLARRRWGRHARNRLFVDDGGPGLDLPDAKIVRCTETGLSPDVTDPHMLDRLARFLANQEEVVVSCPPERREAWGFVLKSAGVHGEIVSDAAQHVGVLGVSRYDEQGRTGLVVSTGPLGLRARVGKRLFDTVAASTALLLLSPLMILIALAIKLEDGGPVLFVQQRAGRANRLFGVLKFRSMRVDGGDRNGAVSTGREDARLTRIGRLIRRNSMDELPQLWNVLRGDMSIVGPRPHALGSQAGEKLFWEVDRRYWHRHSLKPGLTGLAQVRGQRGTTEREADLAMRLQSDLEYIARWSIWQDIAIILRTLPVLRHDRAY